MESVITFIQQNTWVFVLVALWTIPWKGYALWKAARLAHRNWFIILLVTNTLAILDIIYIFFVARKDRNAEADGERAEQEE